MHNPFIHNWIRALGPLLSAHAKDKAILVAHKTCPHGHTTCPRHPVILWWRSQYRQLLPN